MSCSTGAGKAPPPAAAESWAAPAPCRGRQRTLSLETGLGATAFVDRQKAGSRAPRRSARQSRCAGSSFIHCLRCRSGHRNPPGTRQHLRGPPPSPRARCDAQGHHREERPSASCRPPASPLACRARPKKIVCCGLSQRSAAPGVDAIEHPPRSRSRHRGFCCWQAIRLHSRRVVCTRLSNSRRQCFRGSNAFRRFGHRPRFEPPPSAPAMASAKRRLPASWPSGRDRPESDAAADDPGQPGCLAPRPQPRCSHGHALSSQGTNSAVQQSPCIPGEAAAMPDVSDRWSGTQLGVGVVEQSRRCGQARRRARGNQGQSLEEQDPSAHPRARDGIRRPRNIAGGGLKSPWRSAPPRAGRPAHKGLLRPGQRANPAINIPCPSSSRQQHPETKPTTRARLNHLPGDATHQAPNAENSISSAHLGEAGLASLHGGADRTSGCFQHQALKRR